MVKLIEDTTKTEIKDRFIDGINSLLADSGLGRDLSGNKIYRYPINPDDKGLATISFTELKLLEDPSTDNNFIQSYAQNGNSVVMHLPAEGITVNDSASYDNAELGVFGEAASKGKFKSLGDASIKASNEITKSIGDLFDLKSDSKNVLPVVTKIIQRTKFATGNVGKGVSARIGRVANPYLRAIFEQVDRRSFDFSFEMIPNSSREAKEIEKIIKFFRSSLYPEIDHSIEEEDLSTLKNLGVENFVYKFPSKFKIKYLFRGQEGVIGHSFKECFLTDVSTTFDNQGSMTYHDNGKFMSYLINLKFTEEVALTREDIERGF